jgi:hypothetical protein
MALRIWRTVSVTTIRALLIVLILPFPRNVTFRFAHMGASLWPHLNTLIGSWPSPVGVTLTGAPQAEHS